MPLDALIGKPSHFIARCLTDCRMSLPSGGPRRPAPNMAVSVSD